MKKCFLKSGNLFERHTVDAHSTNESLVRSCLLYQLDSLSYFHSLNVIQCKLSFLIFKLYFTSFFPSFNFQLFNQLFNQLFCQFNIFCL